MEYGASGRYTALPYTGPTTAGPDLWAYGRPLGSWPETAFGEVRTTRGPGSRLPFSDLRSASTLGIPQKRRHKCFGCSRFQVGREKDFVVQVRLGSKDGKPFSQGKYIAEGWLTTMGPKAYAASVSFEMRYAY